MAEGLLLLVMHDQSEKVAVQFPYGARTGYRNVTRLIFNILLKCFRLERIATRGRATRRRVCRLCCSKSPQNLFYSLGPALQHLMDSMHEELPKVPRNLDVGNVDHVAVEEKVDIHLQTHTHTNARVEIKEESLCTCGEKLCEDKQLQSAVVTGLSVESLDKATVAPVVTG